MEKDMEKLRLGKVTAAVGLKGELRVYPYTDYKEKFEEVDYVLIDDRRFPIEKVRYMKDMAVLKLSGIDDRTGRKGTKARKFSYFEKMRLLFRRIPIM